MGVVCVSPGLTLAAAHHPSFWFPRPRPRPFSMEERVDCQRALR
jgi:hypothetical protein